MHLFRKALRAVVAAIMVAAATISAAPTANAQAFVHPGCLETAADFSRMHTKVIGLAQSPWNDSWNVLIANSHAQPSYTASPVQHLTRGVGVSPYNVENYPNAMNDAAAAYQLSLRYQINNDTTSAAAAVNILNAWANTLVGIGGDPNATLNGIYGYEFACAAENLRGYSGWSPSAFAKFQYMMGNLFYPLCHDFLVRHDGTCASYMWASWDEICMAEEMAIGVLCDNRGVYNDGVWYWYHGVGNGRIDWSSSNSTGAIVALSSGLGQGQEEGRDQGHSGLETSLQGVIGTIGQNQGENLFGYSSNKITTMFEYFADYNLGNSVPFSSYSNCKPTTMTSISNNSQGDNRPAWDLAYNQFVNRMLISAPYSTIYATRLRPEGGGGNYGTTSGGFDQLGFTTLTNTIDKEPIAPTNYKIRSVGDGNYLDNLGSKSNGASIAQWSSSSSTNQAWTLTYLGNGYYNITNATSNMHVDGLGNGSGGVIGQWQAGTGPHQQWMIVPAGSYFQIVNYGTGMCLDTGGSTTNGAAIVQNPPSSSNNQLWSFSSASAGGSTPAISLSTSANSNTQPAGTLAGWVSSALSYSVIATGSPTSYGGANLPPGLSINASTGVVSGTPTSAGTWNVALTASNSSGTATGALYITINQYSEPVANGNYKIVNRNSGLCMDVVGGGTANGTAIDQWSYGSATNQQWTLSYIGSGLYEIASVRSGTALDISSGTNNCDIWTYGSSANQQYYLVSTGGGYYDICPSNMGTQFSIAVPGSSTSGGTVLQFEWETGGNNEQWAFQAP